MSIFDFFRKKPTTEADELIEELNKQLFPGGKAEVMFRAKVVHDICNGKLSELESALVCCKAKARFRITLTKFDGVKHLGRNAADLIAQTKQDSEGKLSSAEAAAVIHYVIFDKVDQSIGTEVKLKEFLNGMFGADGVGVCSDVIPSGLGDFGLDPTNPIPVRGIGSSKIYLSGLRLPNGKPITFNRVKSLQVPNIDGNIDEYQIMADAKPICKLYVSPYHQKISERPPEGFILIRVS